MPLMPKRVKYRKVQRGRMHGEASAGDTIAFGEYGLQALEKAWILGRQIEACRVAINRSMKHKGKLWVRIFPAKPITKKPIETRMGKGKGDPEAWAAVVKAGHVLFEIDGIPESSARESLKIAAAKLPIRTRFMTRTKV